LCGASGAMLGKTMDLNQMPPKAPEAITTPEQPSIQAPEPSSFVPLGMAYTVGCGLIATTRRTYEENKTRKLQDEINKLRAEQEADSELKKKVHFLPSGGRARHRAVIHEPPYTEAEKESRDRG
jgi:hypothetical protein